MSGRHFAVTMSPDDRFTKPAGTTFEVLRSYLKAMTDLGNFARLLHPLDNDEPVFKGKVTANWSDRASTCKDDSNTCSASGVACTHIGRGQLSAGSKPVSKHPADGVSGLFALVNFLYPGTSTILGHARDDYERMYHWLI